MLLREHNGLTYSSSCSTEYLRVGGEFQIYTILDPSKLFNNNNTVGKKKGVLPLLIGLIRELIHRGITKEELEIAKGNYQGKLLLQQENVNNQAEYNGLQSVLYADEALVHYADIYTTCYAKVSLTDMNQVIRRYFTASNMFVSIIGEKGKYYPSLEKIQNECERLFH
jgi:predicted Zn-dependent peptidase